MNKELTEAENTPIKSDSKEDKQKELELLRETVNNQHALIVSAEQRGYEKAKQEQGEWQLCPKCNGNGFISGHQYSSSVTQQCDVCYGAKIITKPVTTQGHSTPSTIEVTKNDDWGIGWDSAITYANNLCVQISDDYNYNDMVRDAHTANYCATQIRKGYGDRSYKPEPFPPNDTPSTTGTNSKTK